MTEPEPLTLDGMPDAPEPATEEPVPVREAEPLTAREKQMLLMEQKWFQFPGVKETRIREAFALSATQYYQQLNQLLEKPAALAWDPVTVNRLRRLREQNQRSRSTRRT